MSCLLHGDVGWPCSECFPPLTAEEEADLRSLAADLSGYAPSLLAHDSVARIFTTLDKARAEAARLRADNNSLATLADMQSEALRDRREKEAALKLEIARLSADVRRLANDKDGLVEQVDRLQAENWRQHEGQFRGIER